MANNNPAALPDGWPDAFDDEGARLPLRGEPTASRREHRVRNQQEAKALALLRISLIIIAASGIFGDLRIETSSPLEWGLVVGASVLALVSSAGVGGLAFWILHPQAWHTGADVGWLARWSDTGKRDMTDATSTEEVAAAVQPESGASKRDMKDATLETFVEGFGTNTEITRKRGDRLVWLLRAVAIQTVCVVFVQVAAAAESLAGSGY